MQEISLEQFEMTNESMSKVLGGKESYSTPGVYNATQDKWCESDSGVPGEGQLQFADCHRLDSNGNYID